MHNTQLQYNPAEADWSRGMRGNTLISPINLTNFIVYSTSRDEPKAVDLVQTLQKVCPPMGVSVTRPEIKTLRDDRTDSFIKAITHDLVPGHKIQMVRHMLYKYHVSCSLITGIMGCRLQPSICSHEIPPVQYIP